MDSGGGSQRRATSSVGGGAAPAVGDYATYNPNHDNVENGRADDNKMVDPNFGSAGGKQESESAETPPAGDYDVSDWWPYATGFALLFILVADILAIIGWKKLDDTRSYVSSACPAGDASRFDELDCHCYGPAQPTYKYAYLFGNVSLAFFIQSRQYVHEAKKIDLKYNHFFVVLASVFLFLDLLYVWLTTIPFWTCVNLLEFNRQLLVWLPIYALNVFIACLGDYGALKERHFHLHYETLYFFSVMLLVELGQVHVEHGHYHDFVVFSYFNIKLGLFLFEAYSGDQFQNVLFFVNTRERGICKSSLWKIDTYFTKDPPYIQPVLVFYFYMGGKMLKQCYLTQDPSVMGMPERVKGLWWFGCWLQVTAQVIMVTALTVKAKEAKDGATEALASITTPPTQDLTDLCRETLSKFDACRKPNADKQSPQQSSGLAAIRKELHELSKIKTPTEREKIKVAADAFFTEAEFIYWLMLLVAAAAAISFFVLVGLQLEIP